MQDRLEDFYSQTEKLAALLIQKGVEISSYKQKYQGNFSQLDSQTQDSINKNLSTLISGIEIIFSHNNPSDQFREICDYFNLEPLDKKVFSRFSSEMVWEIVDFNINQLFRNEKQFHVVSYTIEDLETHSPWTLYKRPDEIMQHLIEATEQLKVKEDIIELNHIRPYVLQEIFEGHNNRIAMYHQFACPLVDKVTKERKAFVSALYMKLLSHGDKEIVIG